VAIVTTRQRARARSGARGAPAGRATGRSRSSAKPRTRKAPAPPPKPPSLTSRALRVTVRVLAEHADDIVGLLLVAAAVVLGLGLYADAGGPVGLGAADAAGRGVGWLRFALPPLLLLAGGSLIWRPAPIDEESLDIPSARAYVAVGGALVVLATAGGLHLLGGTPPASASEAELRDAAGLLGVGIGTPLHSALGTAGAAAVLAMVAVVGLIVLTRTPIKVATDRTVAGVKPFASVVSTRLGKLFLLPDPDGEPGADEPYTRLEDLDEHDTIELSPMPRGKRARKALNDDTLEDVLADGRPDAADVAADGEGAGVPGEGADAAGAAARRRPRPKIVVPEPDEAPPEQIELALGAAARASAWKLPQITLLERSGSQQVDRKAVEDTGRTLEKALADHGVETRLVGMVVGPTVTRFELELGPGVKVNRVTSLHKDIAYAMATPDVRILAPIPGKQAIGVEVPNVRRQIVAVGDILVSEEARKATHPLEVAVGRDINGRSVMMNLASMPHLLIAGATGAGKSSCLNSLLTSILMRSTPDQVRMILVDPKRVEMGQYDRLPHLLTQVVTNPKKAANALAWAVKEMERRYDLLAEVGFRDITGYNRAVDKGDLVAETDVAGDVVREYPRLPFILIVIDELADLMMVAARDVEESIARIAQMARAVGIHLVIATQRPSVNVITGLIKANVPARLAFAVSSVTDSRVILDQAGAERLIGKGDMLLLDGGSSVARRIQGAWVTEDEVRKVASVWKRQAPDVAFDDSVQGSDTDGREPGAGGGGGGAGGDDDDDMLFQAMELVVRSQLGSTSMLQRKLRVGFARAGRLMDLLEQRGVVGPSEGSKARAVLMTVDELDELLDQRD
jgi:DNA segregation ATPase FtsK/SpoIIIE, S-DNA-T family